MTGPEGTELALTLLLVALAGFAAQLVDGSLGMGFGVSSASVMGSLAYAPAVVSASVHVAKIASGLASGGAHLAFGNVDKRIGGILAASGSVGAAVGATVLLGFAAQYTKPAVAVILLVLGVRIFLKFYARTAREGSRTSEGGEPGSLRLPGKRLALVGVIGGTIDAMGGGGWGPICTPVLAGNDSIGPRKAVGSVNIAEIAVAATTVTVLGIGMGGKGVPWAVVGALVVGSVVAAPIAAWVCSRLPAGPLGMAIGILLIGLNARTLLAMLEPLDISVTVAPNTLWVPLMMGLAAIAGVRWRGTAEARQGRPRD